MNTIDLESGTKEEIYDAVAHMAQYVMPYAMYLRKYGKWKIDYVLSDGTQKTEYWSTSINRDDIPRSIASLSNEYWQYDKLTIQEQWSCNLVESV